MPSLSPTMTHGTIASWVKKPGESMSSGDVLCEIETDKATVGFEIQDDAVLASIISPAGAVEPIACGSVIAISVEDSAAYQEFIKLDTNAIIASFSTPSTSEIETATPAPTAAATASKPASTVAATSPTVQRFSPAARHIIESNNIDTLSLVGTSKGGIISKADVLLALKSGKVAHTPRTEAPKVTPTMTAPAPAAAATNTAPLVSKEPSNLNYTDVPSNNMRKVIAKRLTQSKAQVPHFYSSIDCEIDGMLAYRAKLKSDMGVNVSVNDLVIKAAAMALRDVPEANAQWNAASGVIKSGTSVDISVAVATPTGLITPILTNADKRGLHSINSTVCAYHTLFYPSIIH
jgi:pyruvate dehydrogenase E2 component (dihydrolipoamide acetyltransferase)